MRYKVIHLSEINNFQRVLAQGEQFITKSFDKTLHQWKQAMLTSSKQLKDNRILFDVILQPPRDVVLIKVRQTNEKCLSLFHPAYSDNCML